MLFAEFCFFPFRGFVTPGPSGKFQLDLALDEHWIVGTGIQFFEVIAEGVIGELFHAGNLDIQLCTAAQRELRLIIQNRRSTQFPV